eukprot:15448585-Alexandrium_andersonii.AAC.1
MNAYSVTISPARMPGRTWPSRMAVSGEGTAFACDACAGMVGKVAMCPGGGAGTAGATAVGTGAGCPGGGGVAGGVAAV